MTLVLHSPGPILFSWGAFALRWYSLLISFAVLLGVILARHLARRRGIPPEFMINLLPWLMAGSLPIARLYYVVFEWERYRDGPWWQVLAIWQGGIAIHGALIGGAVALYVFVRRNRLQFWSVADCIVPSVILGQAIGRWGNFFNNEAYGQALAPDSPVWIQLQLPDGSRVHPTFLYESLWNFGLFGIFGYLSCRHNLPSGSLLGLYLVGYSLGRFWIEGLRTDSLMLGSLRVAQVMSLLLIGVGGLLLVGSLRRTPSQTLSLATSGEVTKTKNESDNKSDHAE
ncbi:MAG: prolipoprotein diacylglyceryl transferase [Cyanobacteriota bacterium]